MGRHSLQPRQLVVRKLERYRLSMFAKPILFAIIAACGVPPNTATSPTAVSHPEDRAPPPELPQEEDHYFCCDSVSKGSGDGCAEILASAVIACSNVLYCDGGYPRTPTGT